MTHDLDTSLTIVLRSGATLRLDTTAEVARRLIADHARGRRRGIWTDGTTTVRRRAIEAVGSKPLNPASVFAPSTAMYVQASS